VQSAGEASAQGIGAAKAAISGNIVKRVVGLLEPSSHRLDANPLDVFGGRQSRLVAKDTGEIAGRHSTSIRQAFDRKIMAQVLDDPGLQLDNRAAVRRLQAQSGAELRLPTRPPEIQNHFAGDAERKGRSEVFLH